MWDLAFMKSRRNNYSSEHILGIFEDYIEIGVGSV